MSEFLVSMKSKKAKQKDSSSPHSSSSGLSSKGLLTTAEVPNKERDNLVNISDCTECQFEKYGDNNDCSRENFQLSYVLVMTPARYQEFLRLK